ncbi:hypothetical protein [Dulcicalothrix desertica]|nr:hypothetical protein [Dulcicalothrix desertica]
MFSSGATWLNYPIPEALMILVMLGVGAVCWIRRNFYVLWLE